MRAVDDADLDAGGFEHFVKRQPVNARGLHRHGRDPALAQMIAGRCKARLARPPAPAFPLRLLGGKRIKAARRLARQGHENLRAAHVDARRVRMNLVQHNGSFQFEFACLHVPGAAPGGETTKGQRHAAKRERPARRAAASPQQTDVTKKPRATTGANLRNGHKRTGRRAAKLSRHRHAPSLRSLPPPAKHVL